MTKQDTIALFGESEKGKFHTAYFCYRISELVDNFGNPPKESQGLHFAIQSLLFHHNIIFFRVKEEGFSIKDYMLGLRFLERYDKLSHLAAIALPGVGDAEIIEASSPICINNSSILITTESDLYDYLTH